MAEHRRGRDHEENEEVGHKRNERANSRDIRPLNGFEGMNFEQQRVPYHFQSQDDRSGGPNQQGRNNS